MTPDASRSLPRTTLAGIRRIYRQYHETFGRYPNLLWPRRFSEKMQWRKLFDLNPDFAILSDKLASREFIISRVPDARLPPLLWTGSDPESIPFDQLEPPYVLKCSHGSGYNVIVTDPATLDVADARAKLRTWLGINFGRDSHEPGYIPVQPLLLAERMMLEDNGTPPTEHKFFVFDGKARVIHTNVFDRARARFDAFHDPGWRRLEWHAIQPQYPGELERPERLDQFVALAERLGAGFDHVRVDLYEWEGHPWVGELTLYNRSGLKEFKPDEAEVMLGDWWQLRHPWRRALAATRLW